jgi:xanthine dehydrogenase YagR molybdenum-binding subunit
MRDHAGFLVGWGVGTATFPALMFEGHAKAVLRQDGSGVMEIGAHDMGQGLLTPATEIRVRRPGLPSDLRGLRA